MTSSMQDMPFKSYDPNGRGYAQRIEDHTWEEYKDELAALHRNGYSRKEMVRVLREKYGFEPSLRQINTRMMKWGFTVYASRVANKESMASTPGDTHTEIVEDTDDRIDDHGHHISSQRHRLAFSKLDDHSLVSLGDVPSSLSSTVSHIQEEDIAAQPSHDSAHILLAGLSGHLDVGSLAPDVFHDISPFDHTFDPYDGIASLLERVKFPVPVVGSNDNVGESSDLNQDGNHSSISSFVIHYLLVIETVLSLSLKPDEELFRLHSKLSPHTTCHMPSLREIPWRNYMTILTWLDGQSEYFHHLGEMGTVFSAYYGSWLKRDKCQVQLRKQDIDRFLNNCLTDAWVLAIMVRIIYRKAFKRGDIMIHWRDVKTVVSRLVRDEEDTKSAVDHIVSNLLDKYERRQQVQRNAMVTVYEDGSKRKKYPFVERYADKMVREICAETPTHPSSCGTYDLLGTESDKTRDNTSDSISTVVLGALGMTSTPWLAPSDSWDTSAFKAYAQSISRGQRDECNISVWTRSSARTASTRESWRFENVAGFPRGTSAIGSDTSMKDAI